MPIRPVLTCPTCRHTWALPDDVPERKAWGRLLRAGAAHQHATTITEREPPYNTIWLASEAEDG